MAGIQSKLFVILLCSISLIAPFADAIDVKYCNKKSNYAVKVSGVEINPYPIERGTETTFTIKASTGTLFILVSLLMQNKLGNHENLNLTNLFTQIVIDFSF
ncbi:putative sterol transport protein NPC2 [Helianthus debilis subsp. tardiflorus]